MSKRKFLAEDGYASSGSSCGASTELDGGLGGCCRLFGNETTTQAKSSLFNVSIPTKHSAETSVSPASSGNRSRTARLASAPAGPAGTPNEYQINEANAEAVLVQELNSLSIQERQRVYEDVHGIADKKQETSEFIESCCAQVQREIRKIKQRPAYYKATFLRPNAFTSKDFVVHFLRAEDYIPKRAARRIVDYFEFKLSLFGLGRLCKTITLDDLDDDDLRYLRTGRVQLLGKDRTGRPVVVAFSRKRAVYKEIETVARAYWYLFEVGMEYPDATKHGLVLMMYDAGVVTDCQHEAELFRQYKDIGFLRIGAKFMACHPLALTAAHFCFDNPSLAAPMYAVQHIIGRRGRVRYRSHSGSITECMYKLMTFGIDTRNFPIDSGTGHVLVEPFVRWLEERRQLERTRRQARQADLDERGVIEIPKEGDCLLGRGRPFQEFPGNQALSTMVDGYWEKYQQSRMKEKQAMTIEIVKRIQQQGFRFLKKKPDDQQFWVEVSHEKAREKVSHAFRNNTVLRKENGTANSAAPMKAMPTLPMTETETDAQASRGGEHSVPAMLSNIEPIPISASTPQYLMRTNSDENEIVPMSKHEMESTAGNQQTTATIHSNRGNHPQPFNAVTPPQAHHGDSFELLDAPELLEMLNVVEEI